MPFLPHFFYSMYFKNKKIKIILIIKRKRKERKMQVVLSVYANQICSDVKRTRGLDYTVLISELTSQF